MRKADGEWLVTSFGETWRVWLEPEWARSGEAGTSRVDLVGREDVLGALLFAGFDATGACRDDVARALLEIYDALTGAALLATLDHPDRPSSDPRAHLRGVDATLATALYAAVEHGQLRFARLAAPRPLLDAPAEAPEVAPPPGVAEDTSYFVVRVVDEVGEGVDGVRVVFSAGGTTKTAVTDPAGVARVDGVTGSKGAARLGSVAEVREKLKPRWSSPREPSIPEGDAVVVRELEGDAMDGVPLDSETLTTLVLTPSFECREIAGTHFEFGRSFVRSSALELLAGVAEALRGDDGKKALVFGHTDLAGTEEVNKALSERRARALYTLLTHDADAWEELYSGKGDDAHWREKWDTEEIQHMLNALGVTDDAGGSLVEDGKRSGATAEAVRRFQAGDYPDCPREQAPLAVDGDAGPRTRRELFLAYAKRVAREPVDAARIAKVGGARFMGCGEFNPMSLGARDEESRRAVVFLFDPAAEPRSLPCRLRSLAPCHASCGPPKAAPDPDGKPPYRCRVYQEVAKKCPCQAGPDLSHDLVLRFPITLREADALPHTYVLESDDGTITRERKLSTDGRANDKQRVELSFEHLPLSHAYRVRSTGGDEPYDVFDYARLPELQARARASEDDVLGDSALLVDYWIDNQGAPAEDKSGEGEGEGEGEDASGGSGDGSAGASA